MLDNIFSLTDLSYGTISEVTVSGANTYIGFAECGSLTSDAKWIVKKVVKTGDNYSIKWSNKDQIYNNFNSLTYN